MRTIVVEVDRAGSTIDLVLKSGANNGQAVLVLSDNVEVKPKQIAVTPAHVLRTYTSENGFPPRPLTEEAIVQVLREHGGSVKIRDESSGWNIYDEIAARLGVSIEARRRLTPITGEPAWRPEVGYARKNLEQSGIIAPTEKSGRGIWALVQT